MNTHPENKNIEALEELSVSNQILIYALEPVGHDKEAVELLNIRPEGFKMDPVTGQERGSKHLQSQFAMGQHYVIPDFNIKKQSGKDLEFVGRVESAGKMTGELFGRAAIFAKKFRIANGPVARGWVWMTLLKEDEGIYDDWYIMNPTEDEQHVSFANSGAEASLWNVMDTWQRRREEAKVEAEAKAKSEAEAEALLKAKLNAISPLCRLAVTNYAKVASILGDKLPVAAHVGMLLMKKENKEAVELYESIAEDLVGMPVPDIKPKKINTKRSDTLESLDRIFGSSKAASKKAEPKKQFTAADGFKALLKLEKQKLQGDK